MLFSEAMKAVCVLLTSAACLGGPGLAVAQAAPDAAAVASASYVGGEVMFVSGAASRTLANGSSAPVAKGLTLLEGDRIVTQTDSHVYVRLRDGGLLVVRPASELKVDRWRFDPGHPQQSQIKYTLENGAARHVSGEAAKAARDKFRFNTPVAAIGVRGTDFTVTADPLRTRVAVQTGGVIVNSLGNNGCRADGLGPCEGDLAVELSARAKDKLVQLRMGERRAEIIDSPSNGEKSRQYAHASTSDRRKDGDMVVSEARTVALPEKTVANEVAQPEPPLTIATWGRWSSVAGMAPGTVSAESLLADRTLVGINDQFLLAANKTTVPLEMPGSGVASFRLIGHDGVVLDKATGRNIASTASDASLRIDFGSRRFETSMGIKAEELSATIQGKGSVEASGKFVSDPFVSQTFIQGLVGGKNLAEAVYLYQRALSERFDASGVASWRK